MSSHTQLIKKIHLSLTRRGYEVCEAGERTKHKEFRGIAAVDLIAVKRKELLLIECGWIDNTSVSRFQHIKRSIQANEKWSEYTVVIMWYPYLYSVRPHDWTR